MCNLCAGWSDVAPWNFHVKTLVVFLAAEGGVILRFYPPQPISTGFTNGNNDAVNHTANQQFIIYLFIYYTV